MRYTLGAVLKGMCKYDAVVFRKDKLNYDILMKQTTEYHVVASSIEEFSSYEDFEMYDLIYADACVLLKHKNLEVANADLLHEQISIIIRHLFYGGSCVLKVFGCLEPTTFFALEELCRHFTEVFFLKLASSRATSSEYDFVGLGFRYIPPTVGFAVLGFCCFFHKVVSKGTKSQIDALNSITQKVPKIGLQNFREKFVSADKLGLSSLKENLKTLDFDRS